LRLVGVATLVSGSLGAITARDSSAENVLVSTTIGLICGIVLSSFEVLMRGPSGAMLRRLAMPVVFALRVAIYAGVLVAAYRLTTAIFRPEATGFDLSARDTAIGAGIAITINLAFLMRSLLGGRTLAMLLTGRYHTPRREERIVLFLDLKNSTALTERLGDLQFYRFLNRVFLDVTDVVLESGGEIYRYVGDEIIVVWPLQAGLRDAACITCLLGINRALARHSADYQRLFGALPHFRGALHAGSMIVGEMGDVKREIVLLGDTMNTASRIEGICRSTGHDHIASVTVIASLAALPEGVTATSLGTVALRGRAGDLELFALSAG
jgi:adenylate cyclase